MRHRLTRLTCAAVIAAMTAVVPALPAAAVATTSTTSCTPVTGIELGNVPGSVARVRVTIEVTNGIAALSSATGLTSVPGWSDPATSGSSRIGFEAELAQARTAVAGLRVRGVNVGAGKISVVVAPAGASWLPANNHYYQALAGSFADWNAAAAAAKGTTFNGMPGYLATVTTAEEVAVTASLGVGGWLGGSDAVKDGDWRWVTGPEAGSSFAFTNWAAGEPNNFFAGGESFLEMKAGTGVWNDARDIEQLGFAIVEFGGEVAAMMEPNKLDLPFEVGQGTGLVADANACDPTPRDVSLAVVSAGSSQNPVEISLGGTPTLENPFDLAQADAWAVFTSPSGKTKQVPFFWFQDYTKSGVATGVGQFRARLKPDELGEWSVRTNGFVGKLDLAIAVRPLSLRVAELAGPQIETRGTGFRRGSEAFTPIGYNIAWSRQNSLADYEKWFKSAAKYGANWVRIWMASWSLGIEWKDTGLGNYTKRMGRAKQLDQVFALAAKYNLNVDLVLLNHGAFSTTTNSEWADNPYNKVNGGPLASPDQFATSDVAKKFWQQRLRYIAARWAAQPALAAWEWWNEVDFTPINESDLKLWIADSAAYLAPLDPYRHLTTNSWASAGSLRDWSEVDFASVHTYNGTDPIKLLANLAASMRKALPDKPTVVAEMGSDAAGEDAGVDPKGLHLHNGQWAAVFTGFNSSAMWWWWDEYLEPLKLWSGLQGLSRLVAGLDLSAMEPRDFRGPKATFARALVGSESTIAWIRHVNYSRDVRIKLVTAELIRALKLGRKPRPISDPKVLRSSVLVPVRGTGRYEIKVTATRTGKLLAKRTAAAQAGFVRVQLPAFSGDIAIRLTQS